MRRRHSYNSFLLFLNNPNTFNFRNHDWFNIFNQFQIYIFNYNNCCFNCCCNNCPPAWEEGGDRYYQQLIGYITSSNPSFFK